MVEKKNNNSLKKKAPVTKKIPGSKKNAIENRSIDVENDAVMVEPSVKNIDIKPNHMILWSVIISGFALTWVAIIIFVFQVNDKIDSGSYLENGDVIGSINKKIHGIYNDRDAIERLARDNKREISRLKYLEKVIEELPSNLPSGDEIVRKDELKEILSRVEYLEEVIEEEEAVKLDSALSPLLISMLNLRDQIRNSLPYDVDFDMLRKLSDGDNVMVKNVKKLKKYLSNGVEGLSELKLEFKELSRKAIYLSREENSDGVWDSAIAKLSKAITIRKKGDGEGDSVEAIISRAEVALGRNNIAKTIKELKKLSGEAKKTFNVWLIRIGNLQNIEDVFANMYERVTKLSGKFKDKVKFKMLQEQITEDVKVKVTEPDSSPEEKNNLELLKEIQQSDIQDNDANGE